MIDHIIIVYYYLFTLLFIYIIYLYDYLYKLYCIRNYKLPFDSSWIE